VIGEGEVAIAQPHLFPLTLRPALAGDCAAVTEIYRNHVLTGLGSFERSRPISPR